MKKCVGLLGLLMITGQLYAQDSGYVARHIELDSLVITASRYGFDVAGFIKRVETDTTFYKAFKNLRILAYTARNDIRILGNKDKVKASLSSVTRQQRQDGCRSMQVQQEQTIGPFYGKDSSYNYYTAALYASLFFTKGKVCGETNLIHQPAENGGGGGAMERHEEQLKQLIFNPGQPIHGVPFIGGKVAIFDDKIAPMYAFSIHSAFYGQTDCYVFTAKALPAYKDKVVIDNLVTYFSKDNMEIVYRDYALSYDNLFFDFDVHMQVSMTHFDHLMVPGKIEYQGNWKVPLKKREHAEFQATFSQFSHGH